MPSKDLLVLEPEVCTLTTCIHSLRTHRPLPRHWQPPVHSVSMSLGFGRFYIEVRSHSVCFSLCFSQHNAHKCHPCCRKWQDFLLFMAERHSIAYTGWGKVGLQLFVWKVIINKNRRIISVFCILTTVILRFPHPVYTTSSPSVHPLTDASVFPHLGYFK